jgi:hypothetical protein
MGQFKACGQFKGEGIWGQGVVCPADSREKPDLWLGIDTGSISFFFATVQPKEQCLRESKCPMSPA